MTPKEKEDLLRFAVNLARKAGAITLDYYGKITDVDWKEDLSPVTKADKEAEKWMRGRIRETFPDHGIIGEEFGTENPGSPVQWILDPIDGTRSFIHRIPLYTTLIGITVENRPEIGVIYAPVTDELCEAATGLGAKYNGRECRAGSAKDLSSATLLSTDITTIRQEGLFEPFSELLDRVRLHRTWGDAYGHMMVAAGRADIMFDPVLNIWDAAALMPVLQESGGLFLDFRGEASINSGHGFSSSRHLAGEVLDVMARYQRDKL